MFRQSWNRAVLRVRVDTRAPLLIKAGDTGLEPTAPDLACVRTHHARLGRTVYIPGSSLKGVVRSTVETWLRGRSWSGVEGACDPLRDGCGARLRDPAESPGSLIHRGHCLACRLFGSTCMKGRAAIRDLFPWPGAGDDGGDRDHCGRANRTELRHGVAINRVTGAVQHGPFEQEAVPPGVSFWGEVALENYQAWQLGALATAIEEIDNGFAQLGSAKSRGYGVARVTVERLTHEQAAAEEHPKGAGRLAPPEVADAYGLLREADLPPSAGTVRGLARRFVVEGPAVAGWLQAGLAALERLEGER